MPFLKMSVTSRGIEIGSNDSASWAAAISQ